MSSVPAGRTGNLLASAVRAASTTTNILDASTQPFRGIQLYLNVTADPANSETLATQIHAYDPVSANTTGPLTTFGTLADSVTPAFQVYTLYPGAAETTATSLHEVQALPLAPYFFVVVTHSSTGNWTYSLSYALIP